MNKQKIGDGAKNYCFENYSRVPGSRRDEIVCLIRKPLKHPEKMRLSACYSTIIQKSFSIYRLYHYTLEGQLSRPLLVFR